MQVKTFLRQLKFNKITWQGVWTRGVSTTARKHRQVVSCICSRQIASHTQHTCELQSWTVVTSVLRFMPNPKSMDVCDQVTSIFIVYLYLRLLYSLPLPSTTCNLTPCCLESSTTGIGKERHHRQTFAQGQGAQQPHFCTSHDTFVQTDTLLKSMCCNFFGGSST